MNFPNWHHKNWIAHNVMKIATEILGVKGLKAHNNWSQQRLYTEWLQYLWSWFLFEMTLLPTDLGISKTDLFLHSLTPVILKDASNTIKLGCGTVNPMICVLQFPLRPRCTGQILVHFAKNLSSVLWDRCPWLFFPYHILPSLTNLQRCILFHLGAGQICVNCEIWQIFQIMI